MKTLIFQNPEKTIRVEAKVDIFATNVELATAGFDTRFTNMAIVDSDAAIAEGMALTEIESSWQAILAFATLRGYSLDVVDLNENDTTAMITWSELAGTGTVAGTIALQALVGTATNWDPELVSGDIVSIDGFTYTMDVITDDLNATIVETFLTTFTGVPIYVKS